MSPITSIILSLISNITPHWWLHWAMTGQVSPKTCTLTPLRDIRINRRNASSLWWPATRATLCLTLVMLLLQYLNFASLWNIMLYSPACLNYLSKLNISWCSHGGANLKSEILLKLSTSLSLITDYKCSKFREVQNFFLYSSIVMDRSTYVSGSLFQIGKTSLFRKEGETSERQKNTKIFNAHWEIQCTCSTNV